MAWLRSLGFCAWVLLLAVPGQAAAATPQVPSPAGPVTDLAGILDAGNRQRLLQIIQEVRERTTAEIAILTVPSTAPETIEEYSVAVFDRWKIGKRGQDNGLLFLVAVQDRRLRITTGYGLEGILPDGKIGEIRDREILPYFRAGRYAEGILRGTGELARVILGQGQEDARGQQPAAPAARHQSRFGSRSTGILLGIFIFLVLFSAGLSSVDRPASARTRGQRRRGGSWWIGSGPGGWSSGGVSGWSGGGFSSGSFGGFGGGSTGGGGAGGSW